MKPLQTLLKRVKSCLKSKDSIVKSTPDGALYVDTYDLFNSPKFKEIIDLGVKRNLVRYKKHGLKWNSIERSLPPINKPIVVYTSAHAIHDAKFTFGGFEMMTADNVLYWAYYNSPFDN